MEAEIEYEMERRDPKYTSARSLRIEAMWDAVLGEQQLQREEGESNVQQLASICRCSSQDSQTKAELLGLDDWKAVLLLD